MPQALRQPSFAVLLMLAWLAVAFQLVAIYWTSTADILLDTDDAMRLVQVREFIAGRGWFDLHEARVQPPIGFENHWSRLIDAGLAATLLVFQLFFEGTLAERLMRTVWPVLWLLPAVAGAAAIAWRLAGREAALVVLVLAALALPAAQHFKPGRIDHHNVQIALALLVIAATVWSDRLRWTAWAAGGLTALALAIGLESLPYLMACGVAFAIRYVFDRNGAEALRAYGLSLAVAILAAFAVSVAPDHWGRSMCDFIAINLVVPIAAGGLLLACTAGWLADRGVIARCTVISLAGGVVLALFASIEPRCLAGPLAMVDPALRPIWLDHVSEMQPLIAFARRIPLEAAALLAFPVAALLSVVVLAWDATLRRDFGFLVAAAAFATAFCMSIAAVRADVYAVWFGMPLVAMIALRLFALLNLSTLSARFLASLLLTPTVLAAGAIGLAQAAGFQATAENQVAENACFKISSYERLSRLPRGLIAANVDFGPFLLALTPHSVLAAPYHRMSAGILAAHQVFAAPPEEARRLLDRMQVTYVVTCGLRRPFGLTQAAQDASLSHQLLAGTLPDWLEPVPETEGQPLRAFRIKH